MQKYEYLDKSIVSISVVNVGNNRITGKKIVEKNID
jgi:hypothetical protein